MYSLRADQYDLEVVSVHPTLEEILVELLDGLRKAITVDDVNVAAGIAHQQMEELC